MIEAGEPASDLDHARALGQQTWDTGQLASDFDVLQFAAPFVIARRKLDGKVGSLEFTHHPRVYFGWREHQE
jgi:uncharacterized protein Usg